MKGTWKVLPMLAQCIDSGPLTKTIHHSCTPLSTLCTVYGQHAQERVAWRAVPCRPPAPRDALFFISHRRPTRIAVPVWFLQYRPWARACAKSTGSGKTSRARLPGPELAARNIGTHCPGVQVIARRFFFSKAHVCLVHSARLARQERRHAARSPRGGRKEGTIGRRLPPG
jgi:hypothetical protein